MLAGMCCTFFLHQLMSHLPAAQEQQISWRKQSWLFIQGLFSPGSVLQGPGAGTQQELLVQLQTPPAWAAHQE